MLERLFPERLDNEYRGWRTALWLFGLVTAVRLLQSMMIIFSGPDTVSRADGIALDQYAPDAAQTTLALFALNSWWRALVCFLGVAVLIRYRTALPIMFVVYLLSWAGGQVLSFWVPLARVGTPPGPWVNLTMTGIMLIGLVLSLIKRAE
ncbi:MAG: hypothetical protein JO053_08230 [Acidobacteria bacterium]|nr:hypothetical protein [Acidobacteriota bacterium]